VTEPQVVWLRTTEDNSDGHEAGEWCNSELTSGSLKPIRVAIVVTPDYRAELRALVDDWRQWYEDYCSSHGIEPGEALATAIETMLERTE
jgi:hypothetical protein